MTARTRDGSGRFVKAVSTTAPTQEPEPLAIPLQLYLLRHADAGDPLAWQGDDADRPLSGKGRRQARRLGVLLADLSWRPDAFLTSPLKRAVQTARIVGNAIDVEADVDDRLATGIDLADLGAIIAGCDGARRVLLVGHDPDFSAIASSLTGAAVEVRKGSLVRIDLADGAIAGGGVLRWLIPPGALPG